MNSRDKWNQRYQQNSAIPSASLVLSQNQHLLPKAGVALDVACGLGGNALLLAEQGLETHAWDIASVAIEQLEQAAEQAQLDIKTQAIDIRPENLPANSYDVITVSHYLDRDLCDAIARALKPNGILFYQTYCQQKVDDKGPKNPEYLLADNELIRLFSTLNVRVYREEALLGDHEQGWRNQAMLVAQKLV